MKKIITPILVLLFIIPAVSAQTNSISGISTPSLNEAEAHIAINPADSNQMAIGYMERNDSLNFIIYYSGDGGNSWNKSAFDFRASSTALMPGAETIGGGDILLAYDKTGKLYTSWIYLFRKPTVDSAFFLGFWASSMDNGQNFQFENINNNDEFFGKGILTNQFQNIANIYDGICDRQWMAVDHTNGPNSNKLYIGFVNYTNTFGGLKVKSKLPNSTSFGGSTTAVMGNYQFSNIAVDANGMLHYTFAEIAPPYGIWHVSSSNGGSTFSNLHKVGNSVNPTSNAPFFVNNRENAAPSLAIDGDNNLHVTWTDYPSGQAPKAYYAHSLDGGNTWSLPFDISAHIGMGTFFANVSAYGDKVSLSTYSINSTKQADYYLMTSYNKGLNFAAPIKLTNQQSNFANFATTDFPGDFTSSVRTACKTFSAWADIRAGGQPKIYLSRYTDCAPTGYEEVTTINSPFQISTLYPNPAKDQINLIIKSKSSLLVKIGVFSLNGKRILAKQYRLDTGRNTITMATEALATGNYMLMLMDEKGSKMSRMFSK